jgi:hypothetical protein
MTLDALANVLLIAGFGVTSALMLASFGRGRGLPLQLVRVLEARGMPSIRTYSGQRSSQIVFTLFSLLVVAAQLIDLSRGIATGIAGAIQVAAIPLELVWSLWLLRRRSGSQRSQEIGE